MTSTMVVMTLLPAICRIAIFISTAAKRGAASARRGAVGGKRSAAAGWAGLGRRQPIPPRPRLPRYGVCRCPWRLTLRVENVEKLRRIRFCCFSCHCGEVYSPMNLRPGVFHMRGTRFLQTIVHIGIAILIFRVGSSQAQSVFIESGKSAVGVSADGVLGSNAAGFGVGFGYSVSGMLDLGLGIGRLTYDDDELGTDLNEMVWGPSVGVYLMKQSAYIPLSIGLGGSFSRSKVSGDVLDLLDLELTGTYWSVGGNVSRLVHLSEQTDFVPAFGISHTKSKAKLRDDFGHSVSGKSGNTSFTVGFAYAFAMADGSKMYLHPAVSFGDDDPTFSFTVGFLADTTPGRQREQAYGSPEPPQGSWQGWSRPPPPVPPPSTPPRPSVPPSTQPPAIGDEQIPAETLELLKRGIPEMTDIKASQLDTAQVAAISHVFKVPTSIIHVYRWARSMAPAGHPNAGIVLYSIEYGDQSFSAKETIRVNADGFVVERSKR